MPTDSLKTPIIANKNSHKSTMQRQLKSHHLQLMSIGGVIGAGFFLGAGKTISLAGTSVLLVYATVGIFVFLVMRAMGELLLSDDYGSFIDVIERYLGRAAAFVVGWSYWLCWLVIAVANTVAITGYVQFWWADVPLWLPATVNICLIVFINLLSVKWFGNAESWLTLIKVFTMLVIIGTGILLVVFGIKVGDYQASLTNLTKPENFMPQGIAGFFAAFQLAVQANAGAELVGAAAAETDNPKQNLPKAINQIPIRVALFFVGSLAVILATIPLSEIRVGVSPFVQLFGLLGFTAVAGVINFVALSAGLSSANSGLYSSARMVYGLANQGNAPRWFVSLDGKGVPVRGVAYSAVYLGLAFLLLYGADNVVQAFTLISTVSSVCFLLIWAMILLAYLRYRKVSPELHQASNYKMPFGKILSVITLLFFGWVLYLFSQEADTAMGLKFVPVWVGVLVGAYLCWFRKGNC